MENKYLVVKYVFQNTIINNQYTITSEEISIRFNYRLKKEMQK